MFIDRPPHLLDADVVLSDSRVGAVKAVKYLMEAGNRRIGFLGCLTTIYTAEERFLGYYEALTSGGISLDHSIIARDLRTIDAAETMAGELLDSPSPPTAFFTGQNLRLSCSSSW